jgi:spore maturation protein CgeB
MNSSRPSIAFFGSSLLSAYWNGAATYYRGIIKYLYRLGYNVTFYEPDIYGRQQNRDISNPEWVNVVVYPNKIGDLDAILEKLNNYDIIIKASGIGAFDAYLEKVLPDIKKANQMLIFWDVDAPATLDSLDAFSDEPFRALVPKYDMIFTYGGGEPVVNAYKKFGAQECIPIYNALDPETHFAEEAKTEYAGDLSFMGNRLPDREDRVEEFFILTAFRLPNKKFILGGNGWNDKFLPANIKYVGHVYTKDHNTFNSSSLAVLNISRQSMANYGYSPATRVFEAAGAGACIITDYWAGISSFFEPGTEILVAHDGDETAQIVAGLGKERAMSIGQAAKARVLADHTYEKRAQLVSSILVQQKAVVI